MPFPLTFKMVVWNRIPPSFPNSLTDWLFDFESGCKIVRLFLKLFLTHVPFCSSEYIPRYMITWFSICLGFSKYNSISQEARFVWKYVCWVSINHSPFFISLNHLCITFLFESLFAYRGITFTSLIRYFICHSI